MEVGLNQTGWIVLMIIVFLAWNAGIVIYTTRAIRAKMFTSMKFSLIFATSFGLMVSMFLVASYAYGVHIRDGVLLFSLLVFAIHVIVGTPVMNFGLKKFVIPRLAK